MSRRNTWATLAVVLFAALAGSAAAQNVAPASSGTTADPRIPFKKYTLPNGLEVILHQDNKVPIVNVNIWYHVGSGDEVPGKSGFAHLFEHMMFQGTKNTGEDKHFSTLEEIGAADSNGSTNPNRTNYYETVPSNQLEVALWLESERMGYLLETITEKSLANQRDVVRNERRENYDNRAYGKDGFATAAALYPEGHPYRYLTIGRHEDVEGGALEDVRNFFKTWYVPSNVTLVLAGDFEMAAAEALVQKWFGNFPATPTPAHREIPVPVISETRRVTVNDHLAKLRRIHYAWHSPKLFGPGDAELDVLASALGQDGTGRLYKTLVLEKQLARAVTVYQSSLARSSNFNVIVDLKDDADMAEAERLIDEELARVTGGPITDRELRRAVVAFESGAVWALEGLLARAENLQSYNQYAGNPDWISADLDRYRNATLKSVRDAAAQYLQKANRVEVITMPAAAPEAETPSTETAVAPVSESAPPDLKFPVDAFRATRPTVTNARPLKPPGITQFRLPNDIDVYLVEQHELPTVSAELVFDGGSINDPAGKMGQAALCMNLLDDGTEALDKVAFEEAQADIASNVSASAGTDTQSVSLASLKRNLDATIALWVETLKRPGLRAGDHERNTKQSIAAIRQAKGSPGSIAGRLYGSIYFGPSHPLGGFATEESVTAVSLADCKAYVADYIKPEDAKLYVVGDVTQAEAEQKFGAALAGWTGEPKDSIAIGPVQPREGKIFFVDVPGAAQSEIYLFEPGPTRQADDYFPTRVMTGILGGDFSSRINMNLREDKGYAYGAGGGVRYTRTLGTLRARASVRADVTKESVLELYKELQKMHEGPITDVELNREKNAAVLSLPGQFDTGSAVLASFRGLIYFGLPLDYYSHYVDKVTAVTREQAEAAGKKHIKLDEFQLFVVGDGKTVLPKLKELLDTKAIGTGDLVVLDVDGKPVANAQGD